MILSGDIEYPSKTAARGKFAQIGSFSLTDSVRRPVAARLRLHERMWRQDLTIKAALDTQVNAIVSTIGEIEHPDPEIAEFLNNNLKMLEDAHGRSWHSCLKLMQETSFWSGFSLSEIMFQLKFGSLYLQDVLTYHPITCVIYADKKGHITEGAPTRDGYHKSGFYQVGLSINAPEVRLPAWKTVYLPHEADYGNHYGRSLISPCYKWYRLKEALIDMMASSLDKLGSKMVCIKMPSVELPETRLNPATGEETRITSLQLVREQIEAADGNPDYLFIPQQMSGEFKSEVNALAMSENVGDAFLHAIAYVDQECTKHILPFFLISDYQHRASGDDIQKERRMEVYYNTLESHRNTLCSIVLKKVMVPLIKWNFNRESADIPPTFNRVYSDRPEDRVATMQMVKGLTENGYLNPRNPSDWNMVRQMVRMADRKMNLEDAKFIEDVLVNPRQKTPGAQGGPEGAGGRGRPTGNTMPNRAARLPPEY